MFYLAYGSNLLPARLIARTPSAVPKQTLELKGWKLAFHKQSKDGSGKCDLVMTGKDEDTAFAAIYELHPSEKVLLDKVEGLGLGYNEARVPLPDGGEAYLYVADPSAIVPELKPYSWYHRFVIEGAKWHGFPQAYIDSIAGVESIEDRDAERSALNARILASGLQAPIPE